MGSGQLITSRQLTYTGGMSGGAGWKLTGAVAILCGTIIGVGIFGLPYVAREAGGVALLVHLAWATTVATLTALAFGELMYRTEGNHRAPGYIGLYLGKTWGRWAAASTLGGLFGGQLVYLLVGGQFLHQLINLGPKWPEVVAVSSFALVGATVIAGSNRRLAKTELILLPLFLGSMALIIVCVLPLANLTTLPAVRWQRSLAPYGLAMFAIWGLTAVSESREFLGQKFAHLLKPAILISFPLCALSYAVFAVVVAAATGAQTTPDALSGLRLLLGAGVSRWFYLFGVLTTFTSYISFGLTIQHVLNYDLKLRPIAAWAATSTLPFVLYLSGLNNFLLIMGVIGTVALGFEACSVLLAYRQTQRVRPARRLPYQLKLAPRGIDGLITLIILGGVSALIALLA